MPFIAQTSWRPGQIAAFRSRSYFGDAGEIVSSPSSLPFPNDTLKWSSLTGKR